MNLGLTFTVCGEQEGVERIFPFDFGPRMIPADVPAFKEIPERKRDHDVIVVDAAAEQQQQ